MPNILPVTISVQNTLIIRSNYVNELKNLYRDVFLTKAQNGLTRFENKTYCFYSKFEFDTDDGFAQLNASFKTKDSHIATLIDELVMTYPQFDYEYCYRNNELLLAGRRIYQERELISEDTFEGENELEYLSFLSTIW